MIINCVKSHYRILMAASLLCYGSWRIQVVTPSDCDIITLLYGELYEAFMVNKAKEKQSQVSSSSTGGCGPAQHVLL